MRTVKSVIEKHGSCIVWIVFPNESTPSRVPFQILIFTERKREKVAERGRKREKEGERGRKREKEGERV